MKPAPFAYTRPRSVEGAIEAYPEGCQDIVILAKDPVQRHF